jgi:transcription antitermination factor NusG
MKPIQKPTHWLAVYTKSRSEQKVFERLQLAGHESFLPLITEERQWSDRKKKITTPLIKSYVFIKAPKKDLISIYTIPGIVGVLKYLGIPAKITEVEINNLKIIANNSEDLTIIEPCLLKNGKAVQVIQGPFEGLIAVYLSNKGKHRVIVKIEALNSFTEISLPLSHIKEL